MKIGRFDGKERLGVGGFGEVWKAWDPSVGRWVALKLLRDVDGEGRARFEREALLAASLEHPNIAGIYEVGEHEGRPFLAMQLVSGKSLSGWSGLPEVAAGIVEDAARALQFAHERGVIHRDLKPANLMLDTEGRVFVLDFGLARPVDASGLTASGMVVGTPSYMPPEQARGEMTDARADVYALGATLYELLTRRAPFRAGTIVDTLMAVIETEPRPPRQLAPGVPPELEAITLRCMEKDAARRYPDAVSLADDLGRWRRGEPVEARPPSIRERLGRMTRRRRGVFLAAGLVVGITVVLLVGLSQRTGDVADVQRQLVARMRTTSRAHLDGMLDRRRAGSVEEPDASAKQVEEICERVLREFPSLAEPHYLLGRLRRAQMDDAAAMKHQEAALARDPAMAEARYEYAVLLARRLWELVDQLNQARVREAGLAAGSRVEAHGFAIEPLDAIVRRDTGVRELMARLDSALAGLEASGIGEGERHCVRGFRAWGALDGNLATQELEAAVVKAPFLEEAYEALAALAQFSGRFADGVRWATDGLARDRGYHPLLRLRIRLRLDWGEFVWSSDVHPIYRAAEEDAVELLRRTGGAIDARLLLADVLSSWAMEAGGPPYEKALAEYDALLAKEPRLRYALLHRGGLLSNMARDGRRPLTAQLEFEERAEADLTAAIEGGDDDALSYRGILRYNSGVRMIARGEDPGRRLDQAIADFDRALQRNPSHARTWVHRANVRTRLALIREELHGDGERLLEEAFQDFAEAIRLSRNDPEKVIMRAHARGMWAMAVKGRGEDATAAFDAALQDADDAVALGPRMVLVHRERGEIRVHYAKFLRARGVQSAEMLVAAEADLTAALALDETSTAAWRLRGLARSEQAWTAREPDAYYVKAEEDLTRAVALGGDDDDAYSHRGSLRAAWARRSPAQASSLRRSAVSDFEEALRRNPHRASTWQMLGSVLSTMARDPNMAPLEATRLHQQAIESGERAIRLEPMAASNWIGLGASLVNRGMARMSRAHRGEDPMPDYDRALTAFSKALVLNAADAQAWEFLGNLHVNRGTYIDWRGPRDAEPYRLALDAYAKAGAANPSVKPSLEARIAACRERLEAK